MPAFLAKPIAKVIAGLALVILVLGTLQFCSWQRARQQAGQSRVDRGQREALRQSAEDAIEATGNVAANDQATAELDRQNRKEITDAEGSGNVVSDAATAAGRNSLCRRAAYRHRPECRVQQPRP